MIQDLKKLRRTANFGLYGSLAVVVAAIIFHFCPFHITYQQPQVYRWMLITGTVLAVLAVVMALMTIRKTPPRLRRLENFNDKVTGYKAYICNLYSGIFAVVLVECILIVLMSDTSLLMVTILLVLLLFLTYPNMYKMRLDLGLTDNEMTALFGDAFIPDGPTPDAEPDIAAADAQLEIEALQEAEEAAGTPDTPTEEGDPDTDPSTDSQ